MARSRTIKTLAALLVTMTLATFALIAMETQPPTPPESVAAIARPTDSIDKIVTDTAIPIQPMKWRNIVVHTTGAEAPDMASRCHFVIEASSADGKGLLRSTSLWQGQAEGNHVRAAGRNYNEDSIGICLIGDFSRKPPTQEQFKALLALVRDLQQRHNIPRDNVYFPSDLDPKVQSPGEAFPAKEFMDQLSPPR